MLIRIKQIFQQRPLLMSMTSFGSLYVAAELSQQYVFVKIDPNKSAIDFKSVVRFATIGTVVLGPWLFCWFRLLDTLLPAAGFWALRKVAIDQLVGSPIAISMFFTGMSLLEGKEDVFAELKAKFLSTYAMSCCFWLPAQAINFCFLPPYTRVAYVGCASFVWVNILCLIKRKEVPAQTPISTSEEVKAS